MTNEKNIATNPVLVAGVQGVAVKMVEFFAGSAEISEEAKTYGMKTLAVDWKQYGKIDLVKDVEFVTLGDIGFIPDIVWASPDCTTYTIAAISTHRNGTEPKSLYAKKCDKVNQNVLDLIGKWLSVKPSLIFFIENPRGMMRHMEWMNRVEHKRHTVWYCKYGDDRAKPTDIWTNSPNWIPRPMCRNYKYDEQGNIIDKHCHHASARRGAKTGTQGRDGSYERSKIPNELIKEIFDSVVAVRAVTP